MSVVGAFQHRIKAGVLAPGQQPGGEGALRAAGAAAPGPASIDDGRNPVLVHRDVVEITQAILHAFKRRKELRAPPRRLLAWEEVGEELQGVTHLLRLDAELVAPSRIEPGDLLALLADLVEAPRQLLGGGGLDRNVPLIADEIVLRCHPVSRLQPNGDLQRQDTEPRRAYRVLGARECRRALLREIARET